MSALENKLSGIKQCAELLLKDADLAISSYKEEQNRNTEQANQVWLVWYRDENGYYDRGFTKVFKTWSGAYKEYKEEAEFMLKEYNNRHPNLITGFDERTYYNNNDYPEFIIDNKYNGECLTIYEYEEVHIESFILN